MDKPVGSRDRIPEAGSNNQRTEYRPEAAYFFKNHDFPVLLAMGAIAQYIARWATRYEASAVGAPELSHEGLLPEDPTARTRLINELFEWRAGPAQSTGFRLYAGDQLILKQSDGPATLWLTQTQFEELQTELRRVGVPPDAYYSVNELRNVVEPTEIYGGFVLQRVSYSPLDWEQRDKSAIAARRIPSEPERREILLEACRHFSNALVRRSLELHEPNKELDREEMEENAKLQQQVGQLIKRLILLRTRS